MIISATSSGGFTGRTEHIEVDTGASASAEALEQALADAGFFSAAAESGAEPGATAAARPAAVGADLRSWRISVNQGGTSHTLWFLEDGSPSARHWQALLERIKAV